MKSARLILQRVACSQPNESFFVCRFCWKYFSTNTELSSHLISCPDSELRENSKCPNGGTRIKQANGKKSNNCAEIALGENGGRCNELRPPVASISYNTSTKQNDENKKRSVTCIRCNKTFANNEGYKAHCRTLCHTSKRPFPCSICGKAFLSTSTRNFHLITHVSDRLHVCPICKKSFRCKGHLKSHHKRIHSGKLPFSCSYCNKTFISRSALQVHEAYHTGIKPFSCNVCRRAFAKKPTLTIHMRCHTNERPYTCTMCPKSFRRSGHLAGHITIHTNEKPYPCSVCNRPFRLKEMLNKHMKTHKAEKRHLCAVCNNRFCSKKSLEIHTRRHTGERPFSCSICNQTFSLSQILQIHMLLHTDSKPYSCSLCPKTFRQRAHIRYHIRRWHKF